MGQEYIQDSLFGDVRHATAKPQGRQRMRRRILITVKAAPNPSEQYGETVCVAGIGLDESGTREWVRLYPINFRHLENDALKFKKYDVVHVDCIPALNDQRFESWKPLMDTLVVEKHYASGTKHRRDLVEPMATDSMCALFHGAQADSKSRSLGLVRPDEVLDFKVKPHPGWGPEEQRKIDAYVNQADLFDDTVKTPLQAPAYTGHYQWRCPEPGCTTHTTMTLDWEFVALQRRLLREGYGDAETRQRLRDKFLGELCAPERDTAFYVGNQAKRAHTFSVLGVYWPKRLT